MIRDRRDPTRVPEWWSRAVACVSCVLWVRALLDRGLGPRLFSPRSVVCVSHVSFVSPCESFVSPL